MKIIIAGGGIGGLATALMLRARHIDVQVYESAARIREAGVGINILPHAIRELEALGLLGALLDSFFVFISKRLVHWETV